MARPKANAWPRVRTRKNHGGSVSYLVDLTTGKTRKRKFFKSKEEAETFAAHKRIERANYGLEAILLPDGIRREAQELSQRLHTVGHTLTSAVNFFFEHARPSSGQMTVADVIDEMLKKRRDAGRSENYLEVQRLVLRNFARTFGSRAINLVMSRDIEIWLSSNAHWRPRTRLNYQRDLRALWNYALKHGYVAHNPLDRLELPTLENEPPGILTPYQANALLVEASKPSGNGMVPYIALGLFAGLRTAELSRLVWSEVDLKSRLVEVTAKKAKTRQRRHVTISTNLLAWLKLWVGKGTLIPELSRLDQQLSGIATRAGIECLPRNALRHSFASHHLAAHRDAAKTAFELGHNNQDLLFRNYRELVKPKDAKRYWAIRP